MRIAPDTGQVHLLELKVELGPVERRLAQGQTPQADQCFALWSSHNAILSASGSPVVLKPTGSRAVAEPVVTVTPTVSGSNTTATAM